MSWLNDVKWDDKGLIPVIAQELGSNDVLMFAWMNREALQATAKTGRAVYFSRSRSRLWPKGEESGHVQVVHEIRMDCDNDVLLLKVTQLGHDAQDAGAVENAATASATTATVAPSKSIACHTGRHSCFFSVLKGDQWQIVEPVLKDPQTIYK